MKKYPLEKFMKFIRKQPEIGVIVGIIIVFGFFTIQNPRFLSLESSTYLLSLAAELGIVAIGISFLMISGEFDLSVGSVFGLSVYLMIVIANSGVPSYFAFIITIICCALIGAINGVLVVKLGIPSFIVTLGSQMFWRGILIYRTEGFALYYDADPSFLYYLGGKLYQGLRTSVVWFFVLTIIFAIILNKTSYGNQVFATGCNERAARAVGVNTNRIKIINFIICASLAGLAGMTNISRFMSAQTSLGMQKEFEAIAAAVIGGNLLSGGFGSILGTFIGTIMISSIKSGLIMMGVSTFLYLSLTGIIIVAGVVINKYFRRGLGESDK